jgi:hypothetical protein
LFPFLRYEYPSKQEGNPMQSTFEKLNLKPHHTEILILNAPASFEPELSRLSGITILRDLTTPREVAFSLAFLTTTTELHSLAKSIAKKAPGDPIVWFSYPKKSSKKYKCDIDHSTAWQFLGDLGFECVRGIAIDDDWSADRFRRVERIKKMTRDRRGALSALGRSRTKLKSKKKPRK